jgi:hypothetical protein
MGQLRTVHGAGHWYLVARHGDRVLRVRPRLLLGETAAGELSFDASCAQLELDVDDDGSILLNAVGGHELEWAGGVRCHRERLARNRGAEIRLFHNVLLLDTDFVEEPESGLPNDEVKEAQIRRFPDLLLGNPVDRIVAEPPPATLAPPPAEPPLRALEPPPRSEPRPQNYDKRRADPLRQQTTTGSLRIRRASRRAAIVGLVALAAIGLAVLYIEPQETGAPETSATVAIAPAPQAPSAQSRSATVTDAAPAAGVKPALKPASDVAPSNGATHPEAVLVGPPEPSSEHASTTASRSTPVVASAPSSAILPAPTSVGPSARPPSATPAPPRTAASTLPPIEVTKSASVTASQSSPVAPRSTEPSPKPSVAPSPAPAANVAAASESVQPPKATGTPTSSPAPVVASQENTTARREAAAQQARVRALFAADQALAQGRLMSPPEANAFALYNRVLALDPESPEAKRGLQSVRARLINNTLASLAGNALEDARRSLKAAADAGADPMLVANLQGEIEYRQGQALPQQ